MKINSKLKIRKIAGEHIVLLQSNGTQDMTKVLALNPSSLLLWESLQGKDFTEDDAVQVLLDNYEVEAERAREDVRKWIQQLVELHVFE